MRRFSIDGGTRPLRVLAIGAHSDDIEIGCGGTLLTLIQSQPVEIDWVVLSAAGDREREARLSAEAFLEGAARQTVRVSQFRDGFLPYDGAAVKDYFESLKRDVSPDVVFTHRLDDRHQDHRLSCELTWNTFRDHIILEYEIPKYEGDLGHPNVFVPIDPATCRRKIELLMRFFGTQRSKRWFTEDLFAGLMRVRGIEAGLLEGGAEAFHARKTIWDPAGATR